MKGTRLHRNPRRTLWELIFWTENILIKKFRCRKTAKASFVLTWLFFLFHNFVDEFVGPGGTIIVVVFADALINIYSLQSALRLWCAHQLKCNHYETKPTKWFHNFFPVLSSVARRGATAHSINDRIIILVAIAGTGGLQQRSSLFFAILFEWCKSENFSTFVVQSIDLSHFAYKVSIVGILCCRKFSMNGRLAPSDGRSEYCSFFCDFRCRNAGTAEQQLITY